MRNPSFIDLQNIVEKLSNDQLHHAILNPEPGMPPVIPVSEAVRRRDLNERYKQTKVGPPEQTTVAEDVLQTLSPSNTGLGRAASQRPAAQPVAVQQAAQMPSSIMPQLPSPPPQPIMPPPQQMAAMGGPGGLGGLEQPPVYARGGRVRGYAEGGTGAADPRYRRTYKIRTPGYTPPGSFLGFKAEEEARRRDRTRERYRQTQESYLSKPAQTWLEQRERMEDSIPPSEFNIRDWTHPQNGRAENPWATDISPSEFNIRDWTPPQTYRAENLWATDIVPLTSDPVVPPVDNVQDEINYRQVSPPDLYGNRRDPRDVEFRNREVPLSNFDPIPVQSNPALVAYEQASQALDAGLGKYPLGPAAMRVPPSQAKLNLENFPKLDISDAPIPRRKDVAAFPSLTGAPVVPDYKSDVDYDKERAKREQELLGEESPYAGQLAALTEREEGIEKDSETNKWLALAVGFSQYGATGEWSAGVKSGINFYTESQKDIGDRKDRAFDARTALISVEEERKGRIEEASRHYAEGLISQQELENNNLRYTFDAKSASFQIEVAAAERKWTQDHKVADVDYASQLQERANFLDDRRALFENEIAKLDAEITNNTIDFANRNAVFTAREAADQRKLESQRELFKLQMAILARSKSDMFESLTAQERQKFDLELKLIAVNAPTELVKSAQAAMKDEDLAKMLIRLGGGKASQALGKTISSTWKSTLKTYLGEAEGFGPDTNWGNLRDKYAGMLAGESSLTVEQAGLIADGVIARAQSLTGSSGGQRPDSAGTPTYQRVD